MAEQKPPEGYHRIFNDDASGLNVVDTDPVAHSEEALKILREQGVEAYQRYVTEHSEPDAE